MFDHDVTEVTAFSADEHAARVCALEPEAMLEALLSQLDTVCGWVVCANPSESLFFVSVIPTDRAFHHVSFLLSHDPTRELGVSRVIWINEPRKWAAP